MRSIRASSAAHRRGHARAQPGGRPAPPLWLQGRGVRDRLCATEVEFADYYFKPRMALSEFQNHLLNSTPIPFLTRSLKSQFDLHRDRLSYILDKLPNLGDVPSPKFVFAHVTMPHPPFVFDSAGAPIARAWPFSFADGDHYTIQGGTVDEYIAAIVGRRNTFRRAFLMSSIRFCLVRPCRRS